MFLGELASAGQLEVACRVRIDLYGSLALTGHGHATDVAVLMGLSGEQPETIAPEQTATKLATIRSNRCLNLNGTHPISFEEERDLIFNRRQPVKSHPNELRFQAFAEDSSDQPMHESTYYSVGGGFVVREGETHDDDKPIDVPFPFSSAADLLRLTDEHQCNMSDIARANERTLHSDEEISQGLQQIWETMQECVRRGCRTHGILPGGLNIKRRAPKLLDVLTHRTPEENDPMSMLDWVDLYALAVNEENAAGGRVVTAPTNGAAGIIPAVLHYFERFCPGATSQKIESFLLTAAAIGSLYKQNASISGAEVGCQGEVGVACSMAAGALTEVLGGTPHQVEEAAEIGMEHNLGLTCDPIKGLVQVPCIERNAMGAVKAMNASRLALRGDGTHFVSLDRVIRVMKRTGADMSARYKETSQGGLAVNIAEC